MKIALITDTHLAAIAPDFVANCAAAIAWINRSGADLVIHLGDITADGIEAPGQLAEARAILDALDPPLLCVPGNHDIGDNPVPGVVSSHKPFDAAMFARFRAVFGPDHWAQEASGWRLFGLNAQLFGTGSDEERAQGAWLQAQLQTSTQPIGLFLHKPWFRTAIDDTERHGRYVPLETRRMLAALFAGRDLRFIASGHTHQRREGRIDGVDHYWLPSTAFVVPDAMQERIGTKQIGMAMLTLGADGHHLDYVTPPGMRHHDLADYAAIFPKVRAALARGAGVSTPAPTPRYAGWALAILFLAYVVAFMDRQVLNLVVEPIKHDVGLSDTQVSLLQGLSFALFLSIGGLPIGRLIDTRRRVTILSLGILFWSAMTGAFGLARGYLAMLLTRIGVGVGEATMTPSAYSLLGDYFSPQRLGLAVGLYSMGSFIGSGLALVAGGAVLALLPATPAVLPLLGMVRPWQMLFLLLVPIGMITALAVATLREPARRDDTVPPDSKAIRDYVARHWRAVTGIDLSVALLNLAAYGLLSWLPSLFVRRFDWAPQQTGPAIGLAIIVFCSAGTLCAGLIGDWLRRHDVPGGRLRVMAGAALIGFPLAIATPLMPTPASTLILLAPLLFCIAAGLGSGPASLQEITPNRLRGLQHAVAVFSANLIGLGLGPTTVALITDQWLGDPAKLGTSLAMVIPAALAVAGGCAVWASRSYALLSNDVMKPG